MNDTTQLLRDLVALPSVNPMGRDLTGPTFLEGRVTAYLEDFFRSLGVRWERQTAAPNRDNIVAWYDPPNAKRTLVLEVHQDTVPTDGMTIDPFGARIEHGRLYGRGACDVKGGMAAMLTAFARVVRERPAGAARVVMACTVDEEFTFLGVQRLAKTNLRGDCTGPLEAIVAEPTGLDVVHAHKGTVRWDLITTGRSCHSSRPELGVNAIYHMALLLPHIERFAEELRAGRVDPLLGPATLSVGRIEGGVSVNTVPDRCRIEIDRRLLPGEEGDVAAGDLLTYLRRHVGDGVAFSFGDPWLSAPPLDPAGSKELVARLLRAIEPVAGTRRVMAVPYGTDAGPLSQHGVPCVVFGPGDIARAHTCDEWVPLDEVAAAAEILYGLACLD
jgi:acetylornithine deacetylase/succinyl-diaminopimelate desuccinylase-like protein